MTKTTVETLKTLKAIAETLNQNHDLKEALDKVLRELLSLTGLQTGWIFLIEPDGSYTLAASAYLPPALGQRENALMCSGECYCLTKFSNGGLTKAVNIMNCKRIEFAEQTTNCRDTEGITHHATVPLEDGGRKFGLLNVAASEKTFFNEEELHLLEAVAFQIGTAIQRMKLAEFEQQNALLMERSRLAQELHDSVNQMLFSVSLTAKAAKSFTDDHRLRQMITFIQELSQDALTEMRALIWQLKPESLTKGLYASIKSYAALIGQEAVCEAEDELELTDEQEHALWRIAQEALNNCKKHAGTDRVIISAVKKPGYAELHISDRGAGFSADTHAVLPSLGVAGMKARAEAIGGRFTLQSELGAGTIVSVRLPFRDRRSD